MDYSVRVPHARNETIRFPGGAGHPLAGSLGLPAHDEPRAWAIFSHCFTCHRNYKVAANVTRALNHAGFGVLRFDFTGLGESEGSFPDTDFGTLVADVTAAAHHLEANYGPPEVLIGHSLGGTASIFAAAVLPAVRCVATISSSVELNRLARLFSDEQRARWDADPERIETVVVSGRPMPFKYRFLASLARFDGDAAARNLGRPLLIFHSPVDATTSYEHAEHLFAEAAQPKSLVSLGDSDHLVSKREDGEMVGRITAAWAQRYLS